MRFKSLLAAALIAAATAACDSGSNKNMMSPDANSFEPIDVNSALGPELPADDVNMTGNAVDSTDMNGVGEPAEDVASNGIANGE